MGSRHTIEYRPDPAIMAKLSELERRLAEADMEAQVKRDPTVYRKKEEQVFEAFLAGLKSLKFTDVIKRSEAGEKHFIVIGNVSVGKSSWLNKLFGLSLPAGYGHTTMEAAPVVKEKEHKIVIWDSPGNNQEFKYLDVTQLHLFHSADLVFVMFDSSVHTCDRIIRTISQIKGNKCVLLMSKCDTIVASHQKTLEQEIQTNYDLLKGWNINDVKIYPTSASGGFKNEEVLQLMKSFKP